MLFACVGLIGINVLIGIGPQAAFYIRAATVPYRWSFSCIHRPVSQLRLVTRPPLSTIAAAPQSRVHERTLRRYNVERGKQRSTDRFLEGTYNLSPQYSCCLHVITARPATCGLILIVTALAAVCCGKCLKLFQCHAWIICRVKL